MSKGIHYSAIIIFIFFVSTVWTITSTRYMTSHCHNSIIFVNNSLILELTDQFLEVEADEKNVICASKLATDPGSRLLLHFVSLDISFHDLSPDRLHIFDYDQTGKGIRVSPIGGIYGIYDQYYTHKSTGIQDYLSSSNMLRLDYMGRPTIIYRGFRLLITSVKDPNSDRGCQPNTFRCSKEAICIPAGTVCNGDSNCGTKDDSDESQCNWTLSTGLEDKYAIGKVITSGVLSCLSFIVVVVLAFGIVYRLNRRKYLVRKENIQVHVKRNDDGKWAITNDMGLTANIHAPPKYDEVIHDEDQEDPPPAYDSLPCSVRNSCELTPSRSGSVTIVCVPNRDIHLYNEGANSSNVHCILLNSDNDADDCSDNDIGDEPLGRERFSSDLSAGTPEKRNSASSGSLTSELGACSNSDSANQDISNEDSNSPLITPSSSVPKKTDSNDNLIRPKHIGIIDDAIEFMDEDE